MTIVIFGKTGQVAQELQRLGHVIALGRDDVDLIWPETCAAGIIARTPSVVINAAAYTAVDQAETDEATATLVNGEAPAAMARACAQLGIPFIHISTDYVFDGAGKTPWPTDAVTAPIGAYGRSKLLGEQKVQALGGRYAILRTSWVVSAHGKNFVKTMLRLGAERDKLTIVADQIGGPTTARDIANACLAVAAQLATDPGKSGTYHFSGAPDVSWADFAREIFRQAGMSCIVEDIPSSAFPTPAKRPQNSRLDNKSFETTFGIARPDWRIGLAQILADLREV